jgi:hypothetical protein
MLAEASLQSYRRSCWKTATIDAQFTTRAAKILWRYEGDELVLCLDEQSNIQTPVRHVPPQPMQLGRVERREFEYTRQGTVTFLASFNAFDGSASSKPMTSAMAGHVFRSISESRPRGRSFNGSQLPTFGNPAQE